MASHVRAAFILYCLASCLARAADVCPAPPKYTFVRPADIPLDDHRIHVDSDDAVLGADGNAVLNGRVTVRQDERSVAADSVTYDYGNDKLTVTGKVDFLDPKLRVRSDSGSYETDGGANFNQAFFQLMDRNGRGFAKDVDLHPDGKLDLNDVRYTSCPVGNEDWSLSASKLNLDTKLQEGVAHHVTMRFKDVPIFYTPYISFPLGDERKSGVLFPSFGHSGSNGFDVEVPYYFNLAPNYDLTVTPGLLTARGVQLAEDFRYLTAHSHGQFDATFLPNDKQQHDDRSYVRYTDITDIRPGLRFDADIASVSDSNYFQSFAVGTEQTSVTFLERRADLLYYDDTWRIRAQLQNFQTIDTTVIDADRPYSRVPRVQASALYPIANSNFELGFDSEAVNFLRGVGPTGVRLNLSPEIRWSSRGPGYFFEPAVGYDFTQYDLQDAGLGRPSTPSRALPYVRVDSGLVFEREAGSQGQRTQTLEPRLVYSFVPYRNQDELPIFDSGLPDLNLTELFRTNRYVGSDRIGDANQVALAVTTRLFDTVSGTQYLSATIGQIRYFSIPRVGLPQDALSLQGIGNNQFGQPLGTIPLVNPLAVPGALRAPGGQSYVAFPGQYFPGQYPYGLSRPSQVLATGQDPAFPASDIVAEVALTGYKHLGVNLDYQWNPYTSQTEKSEISVQYRPDPGRVINIGYRFQQGILKQWDGSFAWPIAEHWNTVGRWVYSLQDRQTIEQVAGFEYKSCCYKVQLVQRRYLSIRPGTTTAGGTLDTSIALQLELTGLSSVGKREDSFLEQSIRGYSTRDPNSQ
ncbi:MAG TPA: LPS assembly protein LptD [Steroidobacteraceae bacterium]|nr:LPS assembly protein LptD [Steroidobacteraceae bacterium]